MKANKELLFKLRLCDFYGLFQTN